MTQICSLLLAKMNGDNGASSFTDSSQYNRQIISNGAVTSTDQSKFNGSSGYFDGSSNLEISGSDWSISPDDDFTVEAWVYFQSLPQQIGLGATAPVATIFSLISSTQSFNLTARWLSDDANPGSYLMGFVAYYNDGSKNNTLTFIPDSAVVTSQWYHVSVTKSNINDSVALRVDGNRKVSSSLELSNTNSATFAMSNVADVYIGGSSNVAAPDSNTGFNGYIADLRLIKKAIYPFNKEFENVFGLDGGNFGVVPTSELADCVDENKWYNLQDPVNFYLCLCVNDGMQNNRTPVPILYDSEAICMNQECPIPPVVCEMTVESATLIDCVDGVANFLIETKNPEYDAVIQMKVGDGEYQDVGKHNGASSNVSVPIPSNGQTITFRLYRYVCQDQRCFIAWPDVAYDMDPPSSPTVSLKSVRYDDGDLMKITGLRYKYVSPFYLPSATPPLLGDYGEVHGGTLSSDSTRDPKVGDVVRVEPEAGNNSAVGAVYRIIAIDNLTNEETRVITLECANYLCDDVKQNMVGWTVETIYVHNFVEEPCIPGEDAGKPTVITVKATSVTGKGTRFVFNNKYESPFFMTRGTYYRFDLSDSSCTDFNFSTSPDGNPDGILTSPGIIFSGTPGTSGAYVDVFTKILSSDSTPLMPFKSDGDTQEFYYYSTSTPNKGGKITMALNSAGDDGSDDPNAPISAPCGGSHTCDRAKFDITINDVLVLKSNLNNASDPDSKPSSKFGGNWAPLPSGIGQNILDRRSVATITQELNDQIFASSDSGGGSDSDSLGGKGGCDCAPPGDDSPPTTPFVLGIKPSEGNLNPHMGVTWVRMRNRCGQTVYSCCIGQSFCPDCPPPDPC